MLSLGVLALPVGASAETVTRIGSAGTRGAAGAPGANGAPGGTGGSAAATAQADERDNIAVATGGIGGRAGDGGDGIPGAPAGNGGDGGTGGLATATATNVGTSRRATSNATATGGTGGRGGLGGLQATGTAKGTPGAGGNGGDANATADATASFLPATAQITAVGGNGLDSIIGGDGGAGGNATGFARAEGVKGSSPTAGGGGGVHGGDGGTSSRPSTAAGAGGNASSESIAISNELQFTRVVATDTATGGDGGLSSAGSAGRGGDARSSASATNASNSAISRTAATATAVGGRGGAASFGRAGRGGDAVATGTLASTHDGLSFLSVSATGGAGGSIGIAGPMTGDGGNATATALGSSDAGTLSVSAIARAGTSFVGGGGQATTDVQAIAAGDSAVTADAQSFGGVSAQGSGGSAVTRITAGNAGAAPVSIHAEATGGGSKTGKGGAATATAMGNSQTGDVDVTVAIRAGSANPMGSLNAVDGRDAILDNAASGSTAGNLTLTQRATAGSGSGAFSQGGNGGAATSRFDVVHAGGGDLTLTLEARSGDANEAASPPAGAVAQAGAVTLDARGISDGDVTIAGTASEGTADASAGTHIGLFGESRTGGNVSVTAESTARRGSTGPGGDMVLTDAVDGLTSGVLTLSQTARGGSGTSGGNAVSSLTRSVSAQALNAESHAFGGGPGANATANLDLANSSGSVTGIAAATAGSLLGGIMPAGAGGGDARVDLVATTAVDGQNITLGSTASTSTWGALGGAAGTQITGQPSIGGGNAHSRSRGAAAGDSTVTVRDRAVGGSGGSRGGDATSHAEGSNLGAAAVLVQAEATGGNAHSGFGSTPVPGIGGVATATASGSSVGGDVTVIALQRAGGPGIVGTATDSVLQNAVSATTSGRIRLEQEATGGSGALGSSSLPGGTGGAGRSTLSATHTGTLELSSRARGGSGGPGANGGTAFSAATGESAGDVTVEADSIGGSAGGQAMLGLVSGTSTGGGRVLVTGRATGGSSQGGRGADVVLQDAVRGSTAGTLTLQQLAISGGGVSGRSGNATSLLDHRGAIGDLILEVSATVATARDGVGDAHAAGTGQSLGGDVTVDTTAVGTAPDAGTSAANTSPSPRGSDAQARGEGIGQGSAAVTVTSIATAGDGSARAGGDPAVPDRARGGDATSESVATGGLGVVNATDLAVGGSAGSVPGQMPTVVSRGGNATSNAFAENAGPGAVTAAAQAEGGRGATGGVAVATARGLSTGGGDVLVSAIQKGGGAEMGGIAQASVLDGAVTGSTAGLLTLSQQAVGGDAGSPLSGADPAAAVGGMARSIVHGTNPGGGDLTVHSEAIAGRGATVSTGPALAGADAFAEATGTVTGGSNVDVSARSVGGTRVSTSGQGLLGVVFGRSDSGDVRVSAESVRGKARPGMSDDTSANLSLIDAVDGATSGRLTLVQRALAGGTASSSLTRDRSVAALELEAGADGFQADVTASGTNRRGDVMVVGNAVGVSDASASLFGHAFVDGTSVTVDHGASPTAIASGVVASRSEGRHEGNGRVDVSDFAARPLLPVLSGVLVPPGDVSSTAIASNRGTETVSARAESNGGLSGFAFVPPIASNAFSVSNARGLGTAQSTAIATGSVGFGANGSADAVAIADGALVDALARATSRAGGFPSSLTIEARAGGAGATRVEALTSAVLSRTPAGTSPDLLALGIGNPEASVLQAALTGNANVAGRLASASFSRVLALSDFVVAEPTTAGMTLTAMFDFGQIATGTSTSLAFGFLDPQTHGGGPAPVSVRIEFAGTTLFFQTYADGSSAAVALDDRWLAFFRPDLSNGDVRVSIETTAVAGTAFSTNFVVALVPEAGLPWLLVVGFAALATRRRF